MSQQFLKEIHFSTSVQTHKLQFPSQPPHNEIINSSGMNIELNYTVRAIGVQLEAT